MKNFYKVSNTIENGPRMDRQWSRISPMNHRIWSVIAPMLFVAFGLFGVNENAWAGRTVTLKVSAESSPKTSGYVHVANSNSVPSSYSANEHSCTQTGESNSYLIGWTTVSKDFYLFASPKDGYYFKYWSTNSSATSGETDRPLKVTLSGKKDDSKTAGPYYAFFGTITVNSVTDPASISVTQPSTPTVDVTYTVTNGAKASDFTPTVSGEGWSYVANSLTVSGTTATVTVQFTATAATAQGEYPATVTLTSKESGGSNKSATVNANVDLTPTISVDPTSYDFGMFTVGVDNAKSKTFTLTSNANAVTITTTDNASIAPFSVARDGNTLTVSYNPTSVGTGSYSKTLRVTATNGQASAISAYQDITLQGQAQATTHPTYECSIASDYMVDDENTIDLQDLWTSNSTGSIQYSIKSFTPANSNDVATAPAISTNRLSIGQAGTLELRLKQTAVTGFYADSTFKTITIHKYTSTFSQVSNLATTVGSTTSSNYTLTYVKPNAAYVETTAPAAAGTPGLGSSSGNFYYTLGHKVTTDKQTGCPDQYKTVAMTYAADTKIATGRNQGVDTVHLYQKETYKYTSTSASFVVSVSKLSNTLKANNSDDYSVDMFVDRTQDVTLTATNTDYTNSPIRVEQIVPGDSTIAKYAYSQASHSGTVTSRQFLASTSWHMTQPENYKYLAGENTFEVVVKKQAEATDCYVLNEPTEYSIGKNGDAPNTEWFSYSWDGKPAKLTFKMWKYSKYNDIGNHVYIYDANGNEISADSKDYSISSMSTTEQEYTINLSENARSVKFQNGGGTWGSASTLNTYVKDVKVTRKTWLNVGTDNSATNGTLTISKKDGVSAIYPGEKGQKGTTVYWSIANGGNLKIKCDDPRFTFSQNTITNVDCKSGTTAITAYYSDTIAGAVTATATVYNDVYNRTFTLKGIIEKAKQPVTWNYNVVRYNDTITDAVSATVSPVTYESANPNIIKVIKDNLNQNTILVAVDTGTVNITAHVPGNAYYAAVDTVHAIKVTMKQLQTIVWNQSLFDLELGGDNRTLTATATSDVEGCISTRLVEYVSSDPDVVYIAPGTNVLQIKGVGTTTVTAFQRGGWDVDGHDYDSIATQKTAIVRDPNAPCESYIYQQTSEYKFDLGANALNKQTVSSTPEIDLNGMIADTCTFRYKGEQRGTFKVFNGTMKVEQYVMVGSSRQWVEAKTLAKPTEFNNHYYKDTVVFRRDATKVRFKVFDGYGNHYYTDCRIKQARFIETTTPTKFTLNVGQTQDQTIYLSYSNVVGNISFTLGQGENSSFSVNRTIITDTCGGHAKNVAVVITYNPQHEVQNEQDVLTISDGTTSCEVVLKGSATRVGRTITWNHEDVRSIYTVEKDTLIAEARTSLNALAGTVEFTYVNNTSTANGSIDANNILSFTSAGTAYVVANTPNHDYYFPAATVGPKRWDVALTPTEVVTAPTIGSVVSGTALSDITVSGGTARDTINHGSVSGTFTVQNGNVTDVGPNKPVTVKFTPEDETMYAPCTYNMYIEVTQRPATDEEIGTVTAGHITFGEKLSDAVLSMSGTLNGHGTLVMTDPQKDEVKDVDTYENLKVLFTPDNTNIAPKELTVSVTVDEANPVVTPQATDITYGQPISASNITTASGDVAGSWAWAVDDTQVLSVGDHVLKANFTSDSANYNNLSNVDVTLKVKKIETLEVEVPLSFCAGGSETFHGETYTTAGTDQIEAIGATRDTVYNVTVTVLQPTTGTDSKTITVGDNESWHGIDLSTYAVGSHEVEYHTTNVAGCDSTVTLSLTVNKIETLNVPVALSFCAGESETFHGETYTTAGTDQINAVGATRDTVYNVTVTVLQPTTGTDSKTITVGDNESWHGIDLSTYAVGSHEVEYQTTNVAGCDSTVTLSLTVNAVVPVGPNTFTNDAGDNDWQNAENWTNGVPTGTNPDVIINGELIIDESVTVGGLTILPTGGVTVVESGTLTVNGESADHSAYGDLHVTDDGNVVLGNSANLKVRDFILDAKLGNSSNQAASGQVKKTSGELNVLGDAYFQMTFDPSNAITYGWYDFVVPFDVNTADGIFRVEANGDITPMASGVDFLVQSFSETRCAAGQKAWTNFSGTMLAGQGYTITFNYQPGFDQNTFLFKKKAGAAIGGSNQYAATRTNNGSAVDEGWNVLGNGTLQHIELTQNLKIQVFEHASNSYRPFVSTEQSIAVGTSFQVQVTAPQNIVMSSATNKPILAPKYEGREIDEFRLSLTSDGEEREADRLWISASEEADGQYQIGHDLLKKGTMTSSKVARMWCERDGLKLCDIEMQMLNNEANSPLMLFAPQAGTYTLSIEEAPADANLYLTYNGAVIWDLTSSPYLLDLSKGTTIGYGLQIVAADAPQITTGVDDVQGGEAQVRKVIIDNKMYIITPEGAIFDAIGKKVQ